MQQQAPASAKPQERIEVRPLTPRQIRAMQRRFEREVIAPTERRLFGRVAPAGSRPERGKRVS